MSAASNALETLKGAGCYSNYRYMQVSQHGPHILVIKFQRTAVKNALNRAAYFELIRALNTARHEPHIKLVVLSGAGDCFTAGNDLTQLRDYSDASEFFRAANFVLRSLVNVLLNCRKIVVALVHGACIGVGVTLCALCDIVYCTEDAYFHAPFASLGICPELGASYLLPLRLGRAKAGELLLLGNKLSAQQAYNCTFVAQVFTNVAAMESELWPVFEAAVMQPTQALKITKSLLWQGQRNAVLQAVGAECKELEKLRYSEVHLNALADFIQRSEHKHAKSKL